VQYSIFADILMLQKCAALQHALTKAFSKSSDFVSNFFSIKIGGLYQAGFVISLAANRLNKECSQRKIKESLT